MLGILFIKAAAAAAVVKVVEPKIGQDRLLIPKLGLINRYLIMFKEMGDVIFPIKEIG